jgi:hypothetical protein
MTVPGLNSWLAAAFLALALYVIFSREPELIMPEAKPRPWSTALKRLRDRWRGRAGIWAEDRGDPEGERFVRNLRGDDPQSANPLATIRVDLPYLQPRPRTSLVTEQRPPWEEIVPLPEAVAQTGPHAWKYGDKGDPPTLVRGMRAIMDEDPDGVRRYVDGLPKYQD